MLEIIGLLISFAVLVSTTYIIIGEFEKLGDGITFISMYTIFLYIFISFFKSLL